MSLSDPEGITDEVAIAMIAYIRISLLSSHFFAPQKGSLRPIDADGDVECACSETFTVSEW